MSAEPEPLTSAEQDSWREIAVAVRAVLRDAIARQLPGMNPEDKQVLVETARMALWLEQDAAAYDHEIDLRNARTEIT
jgi:hypothetical protein